MIKPSEWPSRRMSRSRVAATRAIESRDLAIARRTIIGQAEGILMERFSLDADQAFSVLRRVSQDSQRKLYEVAADLVRTGELPVRCQLLDRPQEAAPAPELTDVPTATGISRGRQPAAPMSDSVGLRRK